MIDFDEFQLSLNLGTKGVKPSLVGLLVIFGSSLIGQERKSS